MALRIRYTSDAVDDLDSIFDVIAANDREASLRMLDRIEKVVLRLSKNPRLGAVLSESVVSFLEPGYRHYVVAPYRIFYRFTDRELRIARVLHCRRDWMQLLFESPAE